MEILKETKTKSGIWGRGRETDSKEKDELEVLQMDKTIYFILSKQSRMQTGLYFQLVVVIWTPACVALLALCKCERVCVNVYMSECVVLHPLSDSHPCLPTYAYFDKLAFSILFPFLPFMAFSSFPCLSFKACEDVFEFLFLHLLELSLIRLVVRSQISLCLLLQVKERSMLLFLSGMYLFVLMSSQTRQGSSLDPILFTFSSVRLLFLILLTLTSMSASALSSSSSQC